MGLSLTVTCAAESLVFYFLPKLLGRLGHRRCQHLVFATFLARMGCYALLRYAPSPWLVRAAAAGAEGPPKREARRAAAACATSCMHML